MVHSTGGDSTNCGTGDASTAASGPTVPPGAEEFGLDVDSIEAVYQRITNSDAIGTPSSTATDFAASRESLLDEGQVELTEEDHLRLERIGRRDAIQWKKPVRNSELQPAVLGHNQSMEERTQRTLRQWYMEQKYRIDKVTNAQRQMRRQLAQLHVDRRRYRRKMLQFRQEEARADVQREAEREESRKILQKLSEAMKKLKAEEEAEKQRVTSWRERRARGSIWAASSEANEVAALHKFTKLMALHEHEEEEDEDEDEESKSGTEGDAEKNETLIAAENAKTRTENSGVGAGDDPQQREDPQGAQRHRSLEKSELVTMTSKVLVVDRKSFQASRQSSKVSAGTGEAVELQPLVRSRSVSFVREPTRQESLPSAAVELPPVKSPERRQTPEPSASPTSQKDSTGGRLPRIQRKSLADRNRLRMKRREEEARKALDEPFTFYRLSREGRVEPVEFSPPKFPTTEPSNRRAYENRKRIERERQAYLDSMRRLGQHTAAMVQQTITVPDIIESRAPSDEADKRQEAKEMKLDPSNWMRIFIRNELPPDVEPGSFEAMQYVDYIRPDPPRPDRPANVYEVFRDI